MKKFYAFLVLMTSFFIFGCVKDDKPELTNGSNNLNGVVFRDRYNATYIAIFDHTDSKGNLYHLVKTK